MKNVLLLVHDDAGQEARLQAALDLTRAGGGHLTCVDITYVPPIVGSGTYMDAYAAADLAVFEGAREDANKVRLTRRLDAEDVAWDWIDTVGDIARCLEDQAKLADLIVVSTRITELLLPNLETAAGRLIVKADVPILAVPAQCERLDLTSAMIAWDGSRSAANALRAAVPLLHFAERVTVLEVRDGTKEPCAEDAARYLSRHGVHARVQDVTSDTAKTAAALLTHANNGAFGYIVMGGYGHSRLREALFGGVTRTMLETSPVPVFVSH